MIKQGSRVRLVGGNSPELIASDKDGANCWRCIDVNQIGQQNYFPEALLEEVGQPPLDAPAEAVKTTGGLDFGQALAAMREGKTVKRLGQLGMVLSAETRKTATLHFGDIIAADWEIVS